MRVAPRSTLRSFSVTAAFALVAMIASIPMGMAGCADQGEGERCTYFPGGDAGENGTSDCSSGLICMPAGTYFNSIPAASLMSGVGTLGVCCPPAGTASNAAACNPMNAGSANAGPPLGDGGFDGTLETGTDAHAAHDGTTDAPHEAKAAADGKAADATHPDGPAEASDKGDAHGD